MSKKIFVGYTHSHSPEDFRNKVQELKDRLKGEGFEVLDFFGVKVASAFERDINLAIGGCDIFLVICDHYATTIGMQLGAALWKYHKHIIAVAHADASIAPVLFDGVEADNYTFHWYTDLVPDVLKILDEINL
jgi:hypothetical protein